jgi:hypothetical protein
LGAAGAYRAVEGSQLKILKAFFIFGALLFGITKNHIQQQSARLDIDDIFC